MGTSGVGLFRRATAVLDRRRLVICCRAQKSPGLIDRRSRPRSRSLVNAIPSKAREVNGV